MLILITRHWKVFFEKTYLSNIEHDVTTSKIPFLSLLPRELLSRYFFKVFYVCYANASTDKSAFSKIAISCCDVGFLSCDFDVV